MTMPPKLIVSQNVINRLADVKEPCTGSLYGILYKNTLSIIALSIHYEEKSDTLCSFPIGIDTYGIIQVGDGVIDQDKVKYATKDIDVTDTPLYMLCTPGIASNTIQTYFIVNNKLETTKYEIMTLQDIYSQFVHIRLLTQLQFVSDVLINSIKEGFTHLRRQLVNGQMVFNFSKTNIYIMGNECENNSVGFSGNPTVGEICNKLMDIGEGCPPYDKKKKSLTVEMDILQINMFKKMTRDIGLDSFKRHAPILYIDKHPSQTLMLTLNVDAMSIVHREEKVVNLYSVLIESCSRYLRLLEGIIVSNVQFCKGDYSLLSQPETYHFFPENCGHFVTKTYSKNQTDESLETARRILHKEFLLPLNLPLFRRANRFIFSEDTRSSGLLLNPHIGLHPPKTEGEVALIKGKYAYYHYCQNNMDDNGWGCAYRSLQTLASWFRIQGFTEREVPTFEDIQKCLVDIGDKPFNFIGSKQWIGSTEVNFVLDTLLNISSKIIYVSSGEDMASKGPELLYHFNNHGSPVMIGGGVLAHTILGIDYNHLTGDIKFLILDPHYTGSEDLDIIQKKGWCGWKPLKFWNKMAYYNMCLPQVPTCI
ncbi:hypothetical protein FQA39_LY10367 [Lamprigera yunnana]|nr:hypothetical protein FQA39_LY10367 [Lamprigera yunnana]